MSSKWTRLDDELVEQGFFPDRSAALRAIMAGDVSARGERLEHAGAKVERGLELHVRTGRAYVSRGGFKLEGALSAFSIDPTGLACLDVGCSTGGFTDCLLKHGARTVCAVDVGKAQFAWSLRNDPRVQLFEGTNICDADPQALGAPFDLAVSDVSFTSVAHVLDAVCGMLAQDGALCTLVKPQFEAQRQDVGAGGVVRDPHVHREVLERVAKTVSDARLGVRGICPSPIHGAKGNIEYFLLATAGQPSLPIDIDMVVNAAWNVG